MASRQVRLKFKTQIQLLISIFYRVRTAVNLYSHCFCAVITYELNKNKLSNLQFDLPESGNNDLDSSSHREDQVPLNQIRKNHQEVNRAFVVVATNEVPSQNF